MNIKLLYEQEGVSDDEAEIVNLFYKDFDKVENGSIVAELETSKTVLEIVSPKNGFIKNTTKLNDFVKVGDIIAVIGDDVDELQKDFTNNLPKIDTQNNDEVNISAKALKIAKNANISLETLKELKITTVDEINNFIKNTGQEGKLNVDKIKKDKVPNKNLIANFKEIKFSKSKMAEIKNLRTAQSHTLPSSCSILVDNFDIVSFSKKNNLHFNNIFPVIAEICAKQLKKFKNLNGFFYENKKYIYEDINIGFTVDINDYVQVPVLHNCDRYNKQELRNKYLELFSSLVANKISIENLSKPTFVISDLSSVGNCFFHTPLLAPYTSGILGLAIDKRNSRLVITLTYDHQMTSGKEALNFLESIVELADFFN